MEGKKRKSILQSQANKDENVTSELRQKRVSFGGKKFVREFQDNDWESYEVSEQGDSSQNNSNKLNSQTQNSVVATSSSLLCTTNEYINKTELGTFNLEYSADVTLTQMEQKRVNDLKNMPPKDNLNPKTNILEVCAAKVYAEKSEKQIIPQKSQNDDTKYLFFNENSNKENIEPQTTQLGFKTFDDTLKVFDNTSVNKTLLSDSDENFETRSFHHDLQRISEHVNAKDITTKPLSDQGEEELPTCRKNISFTIEEQQQQHKTYPKLSKVIVTRITTPMKLTKTAKEQNIQKAQPETKGKSINEDAFSDVSGICPMGDSVLSFGIASSAESSPLLPPAYKKVDLQQLNADCQSGKIKLFSNKKNRPKYPILGGRVQTENLQTKNPTVEKDVENIFWNAGNSQNSQFMFVEEANHPKNDMFENMEPSKRQTVIFYNTSIEDENDAKIEKLSQLQSTKSIIDMALELDDTNKSENKSMILETEKENCSKRCTVLFQNATINEEIDVSKTDKGVSKSLYEPNDCEISTTIAPEEKSLSRKQILNENVHIKECRVIKNITSLDMSTVIEKTMLFGNADIEIYTTDQLPNSCDENVKVHENRRGTIFFDSEEITEETKEVRQETRNVNRHLFNDSITDSINPTAELEKIPLNNNSQKEDDNKSVSTRKTNIFNESINEEIDNERCAPKYTGAIPKLKFLRTSSEIEMSTENLEIKSTAPSRCTLYFENNDLLNETNDGNKNNNSNVQDMQTEKQVPDLKSDNSRKTNYFNESITETNDIEKCAPKGISKIPKLQFLRNTHVIETLTENLEIQNNAPNRETLYFENSDLWNESNHAHKTNNNNNVQIIESAENASDLRPDNCRKTNLFNDSIFEDNDKEKSAPKDTVEIAKLEFLRNTHEIETLTENLEIQSIAPNRRTLYFENSDLIIETNHGHEINNSSNVQIMRSVKNALDLKSLNENNDNEKCAPKDQEKIPKLKFLRNTLEIETLTENLELQSTAPNRRTLYFENSDLLDETNHSHKNNNNDVQIMPLKENVQQTLEILVDAEKSSDAVEIENEVDYNEVTLVNDVPLSGESAKPVLSRDHESFVQEMDISCVDQAADTLTNVHSKKRLTQHFDSDEPMEVDDFSFKIPCNLKKMPRKSVQFSETVDIRDDFMTPRTVMKNMFSKCENYAVFSPFTPHRSLLEFENLESEVKSNDENTKLSDSAVKIEEEKSAVVRKNLKRDTANFTPNLPKSKKRHSIRLEFPLTEANASQEVAANATMESSIQKNRLTLSIIDDSMVDIIDKTEPPSFFGNVTSCTENIAECLKGKSPAAMATTPTRIPKYTGTNKKKSQSISKNDLQSFLHLDSLDTIESGDETKKQSIFEHDDRPITISDVSQQDLSLNHKQMPNERNEPEEPVEPDEPVNESFDNMTLSEQIASFKKDWNNYLETSNDSKKWEEDFINEWEEIDRQEEEEQVAETTDPNKTIGNEENNSVFNFKAKAAINEIEAKAESSMSRAECFKKQALVCRKCAWCQQAIIEETITMENTDSFIKPTIASLSSLRLMDSLDAQRKRRDALLADTIKLVNIAQCERLKNQLEIIETITSSESESETEFENEDEQEKANKKCLQEEVEAFKRNPISDSYTSFADKLEHMMRQPAAKNWEIDFNWRAVKVLRFYHKICRGALVTLRYEETKRFGVEVQITSIDLEENTLYNAMQPIDSIMLTELKLALPIYSTNLRPFCDGDTAEDVFEMLERIDDKCSIVKELCGQLSLTLISNKAHLIREYNRYYVCTKGQKRVYQDECYHHTDTIEFIIEIKHLRKLSYKNIIMPRLYEFKENIIELPTGIDFLKHFLKDPLSYLAIRNENV